MTKSFTYAFLTLDNAEETVTADTNTFLDAAAGNNGDIACWTGLAGGVPVKLMEKKDVHKVLQFMEKGVTRDQMVLVGWRILGNLG